MRTACARRCTTSSSGALKVGGIARTEYPPLGLCDRKTYDEAVLYADSGSRALVEAFFAATSMDIDPFHVHSSKRREILQEAAPPALDMRKATRMVVDVTTDPWLHMPPDVGRKSAHLASLPASDRSTLIPGPPGVHLLPMGAFPEWGNSEVGPSCLKVSSWCWRGSLLRGS